VESQYSSTAKSYDIWKRLREKKGRKKTKKKNIKKGHSVEDKQAENL
jgi:hypothetical protein